MEIKDDDLHIKTCMMCEGRGRVSKSEGNRMITHTFDVACPDCEGRGILMTPVGAKLFDFVHEALRFRSYAH